jgi:hypothetical protein
VPLGAFLEVKTAAWRNDRERNFDLELRMSVNYTLTVDGRETTFASEADAFSAAASQFDIHGPLLSISMKANGWQYLGPAQMRHWWSEKKAGRYYPDIPY